MLRFSRRRLISLLISLAILAVPTIVTALTAAPCGQCM
jgi:hypothetical protein